LPTYGITGGAGFIGSHIAEELAKDRDNRIVVIDDLSSGKLENIEPFKDRIEFHMIDIRDPGKMLQLLHGADFLFHLAALVSATDSVHRISEYHAVDIAGTLNVLQAAKLNGIKRTVIASSAAVYGNEPGQPKREDMLPKPESPYGLANLAGEHYARLFSKLYGFPVIAMRCFNVYGPRQDASSPYGGVVSVFADKLLRGERPMIYGDGRQTRDFVFVKDAVRAHLLAMRRPALKGGEVFNVGTGESTDILTLLDRVSFAAGCRSEPEFAAERPGDIRRSSADMTLARRALGFAPVVLLKEGLAELIKSLKE